METAAHWVYKDPEIKALQEGRLFSPPLETMELVSAQFMSNSLYKLGTERQQYEHYCTNGHGYLSELVRHCELNLSELITADMVAHLASEQTGPHQIRGIIHVYLATAVCFDWGAHWGARNHTARSRRDTSKVDTLWFHFILDLIFLLIPRILCHNLWTVWVCISPQCPGISHPAFLISQRDHTHTQAHIRFVEWGQRSECVFRQLIIFPAPERDGWRRSWLLAGGGWRRWSCWHLITH